MSEAGQQVPLLEGPGASAATQGQELGSKYLTCPSVDYTLYHPECSPKTQKDEGARSKSHETSLAAWTMSVRTMDSPSNFLMDIIDRE